MKNDKSVPVSRALGVLAVLVLIVSAGCFRDPNVRKQEYLKTANDYFTQARFKEAKIFYGKALQIDAQMGAAHFGLAKCLMQEGDIRAAYQEFLRTTTIDPENTEAQVTLGEILLAGSATREARDKALEILSKHSDNVRAQLLLANSEAALGDLDSAMTEASKAVQMTPNQAITYVNLAVMQERKKDFAGAEASLKQGAQVEPQSAVVQIATGSFYQRQQRWKEAEEAIQRAVQLDAKNPLPRGLLALTYLRDNRADKAEEVLAQAKKDLPDNPNAYRMLGEFYVRTGKTEKGLAEFETLHKEHSKDAGVTLTYAQLLATAKRYDEALTLTNALTKEDSQNVRAITLRSEIEMAESKTNDALETMKGALKAAPNDPRVHYDLGRAYERAGNLPQAKAEWMQALKIRPRMLEPMQALAGAAVHENDTKGLQTIANQMVAVWPNVPQSHLFAGMAAAGLGDLTGAETNFQTAIKLSPENPLGYTRLGAIRVVQKKYDEAGKLFDQALTKDPTSYDALAGLALVLVAKKQVPEAIAKVQQQADRAPTSANMTLLGKLLLQNKQEGAAETALQKAKDLDAKNSEAIYILYQLKTSRGAKDEAFALAAEAARNGTTDGRLHTVYGMGLEARGDWQNAKSEYEKALAIRQDDPMAANNLAYLLLEHGGDANLALTLAQTARRGMPKLGATADTLAWASYHVGAYDSARRLLEEATTQQPENATFHYHLGLTYLKLNQEARGKAELQKSLKLNPQSPKAAEIQGLIAQN